MDKISGRTYWIDNLRSFVTLLVVLHHSAMAYTTYGYFDQVHYIASTHAIIDESKWVGLDIFISFNDNFFMPLMFFISGLFLLKSITYKGILQFCKDRFLRLLLPFLVLGSISSLLSYYPSFIVASKISAIDSYLVDYFTVQAWPVGPPWFVWILFVFTLITTVFLIVFKKLHNRAAAIFSYLIRPGVFIFVFAFISMVAYVPISQKIGAYTWTGFGPFDFQLNRVLLYFSYFGLGVLISYNRINTAALNFRHWKPVGLLAVTTFILFVCTQREIIQWDIFSSGRYQTKEIIENSLFSLACSFLCIFFLLIFSRYLSQRNQWVESFSASAYLIFFLHFPIVVWTQFLLTRWELNPLLKFIIVSVMSITTSWIISDRLRRVRVIKSYL